MHCRGKGAALACAWSWVEDGASRSSVWCVRSVGSRSAKNKKLYGSPWHARFPSLLSSTSLDSTLPEIWARYRCRSTRRWRTKLCTAVSPCWPLAPGIAGVLAAVWCRLRLEKYLKTHFVLMLLASAKRSLCPVRLITNRFACCQKQSWRCLVRRSWGFTNAWCFLY